MKHIDIVLDTFKKNMISIGYNFDNKSNHMSEVTKYIFHKNKIDKNSPVIEIEIKIKNNKTVINFNFGDCHLVFNKDLFIKKIKEFNKLYNIPIAKDFINEIFVKNTLNRLEKSLFSHSDDNKNLSNFVDDQAKRIKSIIENVEKKYDVNTLNKTIEEKKVAINDLKQYLDNFIYNTPEYKRKLEIEQELLEIDEKLKNKEKPFQLVLQEENQQLNNAIKKIDLMKKEIENNIKNFKNTFTSNYFADNNNRKHNNVNVAKKTIIKKV